MRIRNIAIFSVAALGGLIAGSLMGPSPVSAVAREIIELQRDVTNILQGQKDLSSQITQDHTVMRTLVEQSGDNVGKGGDDTLFALAPGKVKFGSRKGRKLVDVLSDSEN